MRAILGCALAVVLTASAGADDKEVAVEAKNLIGKWSAKTQKGTVIEFAKDGKLTVTFGAAEKVMAAEGTYALDGNKLKMTIKVGGAEKSDTVTISRLTATEMVGKNEAGKEDTLVRIKDK